MNTREQEDAIPSGYARVTEILKPYTSFEGIDPAVREKAADRGTRVHSYCELYTQNLLIEKVDDDCQPYVNSFIQWYDTMVEDIWHQEYRLCCQKYRFTVKLDMIATIKGDDHEA